VDILIAGSMGNGALNVLNTHIIKVLIGNLGEARVKVE